MALFIYMTVNRVELLAPAGNYESFLGAIHAGADAVYLGGEKFGARAYADNFTTEEICRAILYAHIFDRKVYLTVNTLVKEEELEELIPYLTPFYEAGLDGVIVQDLGAFHVIKDAFPDLPLHVSTQMTITGAHGAAMLKEMGAVRIVPARELSLDEIVHMKKETGLEMETFIHGAMCYCYSGQCLFSSILGGRSGNRGRCAQPCRLPYKMPAKNGKAEECYPLSLKDMCTISLLPKLIDAGIDSFKIEGRMKKPEYAAGVTSLYRKYIDMYYAKGEAGFKVSKADLDMLSSLYIRSKIHDGYYFKHNSADMVTLDSPAYNGSDDNLLLEIRRKYIETSLKKNVRMEAEFLLGQEAKLTVKTKGANGDISVTVYGQMVESASKQPVSAENIKTGLLKLGNTFFAAGDSDVYVNADDGIFYPLKAINELRRAAIEQLEEAYKPQRRPIVHSKDVDGNTREITNGKHSKSRILVSNTEQLKAVKESGFVPDILYVESTIKELDASFVKDIKAFYESKGEGTKVFVALPYITRKKDIRILDEEYSIYEGADGVLVRNLECLGYFKNRGYKGPIHTDANLYCFNNHAAKVMLEESDGICVPYELNKKEQNKMLKNVDLNKAEQIVYGRIPLMITANCISKTNGKCYMGQNINEDIYLEDRYRKKFPTVLSCKHCYNVIYNSVPMSLHAKLYEKTDMPVRISFTVENKAEVKEILAFYQDVFAGIKREAPFAEYTAGHEKRGVL